MEQTLVQFRDNVLSPVEDGMIAAICSVHRCALATRNGRDFAGLDLVLVNPWEQA